MNFAHLAQSSHESISGPEISFHERISGLEILSSYGNRIWEAFRSPWDSGEDKPQLTGQTPLIPSQQDHGANQKYKRKKLLMVEI